MGFIWTQSGLKDFEKETTCPKRWAEQWVNRVFKRPPSEAQTLGNYFEYLCIGVNAGGGAVTELGLTKAGEKTAVQKRAEKQAEVFKNMFNPKHEEFLKLEILDKQFPLKGSIVGIEVEGTADIHAKCLETGAPVIVDIKSTEDAYSEYSEYGWGNELSDLDLIQQVLYSKLYEQMYGVKPIMILLIFEMGTKQRVRYIKLSISDYRYSIMEERFLKAEEVKKLYDKNGYSRIPSEKECSTCPLSCEKRFIKEVVKKEFYNY